MFTREQSKQLKQEFWTSFGKSFPRKWILYNTKMKGLAFKFHFDTTSASVCLDLDCNLVQRINYWEKLISLKSILISEYLESAQYEETYYLENGKEISRIYVQLDDKVSIHNKNTWQSVMQFFSEKMAKFEEFFIEYRAVLET